MPASIRYLTALFIYLLLYSTLSYSQIYKFQDAQGRWHYSDKQSAKLGNKDIHLTQTNTLNTIQTNKSTHKTNAEIPRLEIKQANGQLRYIIHNPLLIPVQCFLKDKESKHKISNKTVPPLSSEVLFKQKNNSLKRDITFRCVMGDPNTKPDKAPILPPFKHYKPMKISQGFNGKFSHNHPGSRYAVDIGMMVGTKITAVREGIVIKTKDDYAYAGVSSPFFFDKANLVKILHSDGTIAVYAHLLLGGVKVSVGDKVSAGHLLGLSGNTGYSTGPHLHFVIQYNKQGRIHSQKFKFLQPKNKQLTPKKGNWLLPYSPK